MSDINPNLSNKDKEVLFNMTNTSKTGKINFTEFKDAFPKMVLILRVKDVFVDLRKLKILNIDLEGKYE